MFDTAFDNLRLGMPTIVTAPFVRELADPTWLERMNKRCGNAGATIAVVWMRCDADSMRDYIEARDAARDTWKLSYWDDYLKTINPDQRPVCTHYVVDNSRHARSNLAEHARRLASRVAMRPDAVILYGPPAAGKDTVTAALTALDDRYVHFDRLKVGANAGAPYRGASADELTRLSDNGMILYANERYGNVYAIDRPRLDDITTAGRVPVVHLGQIAGIHVLRSEYAARWVTVLLWCPRDVTASRAHQRGSTDVAERLVVWEETKTDLELVSPDLFDLVLRTDHRPPQQAADHIHREVTGQIRYTSYQRDPLD